MVRVWRSDDVRSVRRGDMLSQIASAEELLKSIPDALFAVDSAWRFSYLNGPGERLLERRAETLIGRVLWEEFPAAAGTVFQEQYDRALRDGSAVSFTAFYPPLERWFSVHATPLTDGLLVQFHDVNALTLAAHRAAQVLRQGGARTIDPDVTARVAHDYVMAITASIADGLLVEDAQGRVAYANAAASELLGADACDLVGRDAAGLIGTAAAALGAGGSPGVRRSDADVFHRADGRPLPVAWTSAPMIGSPEAAGRVIVFRDDSERRQRETRLRQEAEALHWGERIRGALLDERLLLYWQPIVTTGDGATAGHELLIRLQDPDGRIVAPGEFLPAAERHGLMGHVDCWVITQATELAHRGERVHVNISPSSIDDETVLDALARAASEPEAVGRVTIEITETALGEDAAAVTTFAAHVHELGYRVALDDFGTGYNTFGRVKQLAVDELKIDMQFVRDLGQSPASEGIVRAIISLAQSLGTDTVAEGVEDAQTAARLRELGVTHLQGYHFGRPVLAGA